jgi:hypothetical protein
LFKQQEVLYCSGSTCGTLEEDGKPYAAVRVRFHQGSASLHQDQVPGQVFPITQQTNDYDGEFIPQCCDDNNDKQILNGGAVKIVCTMIANVGHAVGNRMAKVIYW